MTLRPHLLALTKCLLPSLVLLAGWVVMFEAMRVVLVTSTWAFHDEASTGLIHQSFLRGLRFDLSTAVKLVAIFSLWMIWRPKPGRTERWVIYAGHALLASVCIFALIAEVEIYKEFQMRLGPVIFQFFSTDPEHNSIILGMVWHGYPVVRWLLVWGGMSAVFIWFTYRVFFRRPTEGPPNRWPLQLAATLLWIALTVIGSRGGLQQSVLRWGDAFFSTDVYANQMTENGVFALIDTLRHLGRKQTDGWEDTLPVDQAIQIARELIVSPQEKLVDPARYPLLRTTPPVPLPHQRPANVVVVLMESFSARFCGATGAPWGATPHFDELAREGILFDRAFSVGTHTAQGVFGSLCSFPNLPGRDTLMKGMTGQQRFCSLPSLLRQQGYQTIFLYNGLFSWDNKEGFFRKQGIERFVGRNDYRAPTFVDPDWGVCDFDVFTRAVAEFDQMAETGRPFLGIVLTLSNHSPFNLPKPEGLAWLTTGGAQNKRLNGVHYADWAVGSFMKEARQRPWFDQTLFVFVGDHGFGLSPSLTEVNLQHMHVPLLFYAPATLGTNHLVRHITCGQLDILPSVMGLVGVELPHQAFGRNLFALPPSDPGWAMVKRSGETAVGWVSGDLIAISAPHRPHQLHTVDLSFPPSFSADLVEQQHGESDRLSQELSAMITVAEHTLRNRLAAPPSPGRPGEGR